MDRDRSTNSFARSFKKEHSHHGTTQTNDDTRHPTDNSDAACRAHNSASARTTEGRRRTRPRRQGAGEAARCLGLDAAKPVGTAVATAVPTAVAMPDGRTPREAYLDEVAPAAIVGRLIKFTREGAFVTADDEAEISDTADFTVLADQTLVGWLRFNDDAPPDRIMGLLYDGFVPPPRNQLDQANWPAGLSGAPEDPWKHQMYLVLQGENSELFTFATSSMTGRRAVGNLLRHFDRMQKTHPDELPVVRLRTGGFQHRDDRIGWVHTPVFAVVGRAPRDSAAKPDTSPAGDLNDQIPY
jgi:hypothetical protein